MAIVQNPLIGRAKNKLGPSVFSTYKGKNVVRSLPLSVTPSNTDKQLSQRTKMSLIVSLYRYAAAAVTLGYKSQASTMSEYNAFTSENLKTGVVVDGVNSAKYSLPGLKFSKGSISKTNFVSFAIVSGSVQLDWDSQTSDLLPGQAMTDIPVIVVVGASADGKEAKALVQAGPGERSEGETSFDFGSALSGYPNVKAYAFFVSADGKNAEDSQIMP